MAEIDRLLWHGLLYFCQMWFKPWCKPVKPSSCRNMFITRKKSNRPNQ